MRVENPEAIIGVEKAERREREKYETNFKAHRMGNPPGMEDGGKPLSDEQIAGVLTYIRREWEHNGSPISVQSASPWP